MTVAEAFETFKSQLELPDRKQAEAAKAQQDLRDRISAHLYVPRSFLAGSYARHTKIHPLADIDVFLVRNDARVPLSSDGSGTVPATALQQVYDAIKQAYPGAALKLQARSVNAQLPQLSFGFDLVPAWYRYPTGYWIPDTSTGGWIPTDPEAHAEFMTKANQANDDKLKPVIKMIKHWSRNNLDLFSSFHLELICAEIFTDPTQKITDWATGVATALVHLQRYVGKTMMDPIFGVTRVNKELSAEELQKLLLRVQNDAQRSIDALKLANNLNHNQAIEVWKQIFVSGFPT